MSYFRKSRTSKQYQPAPNRKTTPKTPRFSPPPVVQTQKENQQDSSLSQWQPRTETWQGNNVTSLAALYGHQPPIQAKLTIGEVGDKYEQEADQVAKNVVEQMNSPRPDANHTVQREMRAGKDPLQKPRLQPQQALGVSSASSGLESAINQGKGGRQPLETNLSSVSQGADYVQMQPQQNPDGAAQYHAINEYPFVYLFNPKAFYNETHSDGWLSGLMKEFGYTKENLKSVQADLGGLLKTNQNFVARGDNPEEWIEYIQSNPQYVQIMQPHFKRIQQNIQTLLERIQQANNPRAVTAINQLRQEIEFLLTLKPIGIAPAEEEVSVETDKVNFPKSVEPASAEEEVSVETDKVNFPVPIAPVLETMTEEYDELLSHIPIAPAEATQEESVETDKVSFPKSVEPAAEEQQEASVSIKRTPKMPKPYKDVVPSKVQKDKYQQHPVGIIKKQTPKQKPKTVDEKRTLLVVQIDRQYQKNVRPSIQKYKLYSLVKGFPTGQNNLAAHGLKSLRWLKNFLDEVDAYLQYRDQSSKRKKTKKKR